MSAGLVGAIIEGLPWPVTAELYDFSSPFLALFDRMGGDELESVREAGVVALVALLSRKLTSLNDRVTCLQDFLLGAAECNDISSAMRDSTAIWLAAVTIEDDRSRLLHVVLHGAMKSGRTCSLGINSHSLGRNVSTHFTAFSYLSFTVMKNCFPMLAVQDDCLRPVKRPEFWMISCDVCVVCSDLLFSRVSDTSRALEARPTTGMTFTCVRNLFCFLSTFFYALVLVIR